VDSQTVLKIAQPHGQHAHGLRVGEEVLFRRRYEAAVVKVITSPEGVAIVIQEDPSQPPFPTQQGVLAVKRIALFSTDPINRRRAKQLANGNRVIPMDRETELPAVRSDALIFDLDSMEVYGDSPQMIEPRRAPVEVVFTRRDEEEVANTLRPDVAVVTDIDTAMQHVVASFAAKPVHRAA